MEWAVNVEGQQRPEEAIRTCIGIGLNCMGQLWSHFKKYFS